MHDDTSTWDAPPPAEAPAPLGGRPVLVGEVLFDRFPDGTSVLGGAPFNVAWHLHAFGAEPLLITRIGLDDAGQRILDAMHRWGMDTSGVQRDDTAPTGAVDVRLGDDGPSFHIRPDQAYDQLDGGLAEGAFAAAGSASLLYHGTLIMRSRRSAAALKSLRTSSALPAFLDVNLRRPWWSVEAVRTALLGTRWVKLNRDELEQLRPDGVPAGDEPADVATAFRRRYALERVILTMGADGAVVSGLEGTVRAAPPPVGDEVDTVGAGDAFAAVTIVGIIHGWPVETALRRALEFGAFMCTVRGAVVTDAGPYRRFRQRWSDEDAGEIAE